MNQFLRLEVRIKHLCEALELRVQREHAEVHETAELLRGCHLENSRSRDQIQIGPETRVRSHLFVYGHGGRISVGSECYLGHRTEIWSATSVSIGNRVLIAHDVQIVDCTAHSQDPLERIHHYRRSEEHTSEL